MRWLGPILREIFGLFVDDGSLALIILCWLTVVGAWSCLRHSARLERHTG